MIDFHAHIDLYADPIGVVQQIANRGMYVLSVTTTPSAWKGTASLVNDDVKIRTALGLHPQLAHQRFKELELFDELIHLTDYVGEIGLDGASEFKSHWDIQVSCFEHILASCASNHGKVMSIHSRRAAKQVLDFLEKYPSAGVPILHWYSGSLRDLKRAIELGCWFGVGPAMLASINGRKLISNMPIDRILTESDGPFAQVNGKSAMPWDVSLAIVELACIWQKPVQFVESRLMANLKEIVTLMASRK